MKKLSVLIILLSCISRSHADETLTAISNAKLDTQTGVLSFGNRSTFKSFQINLVTTPGNVDSECNSDETAMNSTTLKKGTLTWVLEGDGNIHTQNGWNEVMQMQSSGTGWWPTYMLTASIVNNTDQDITSYLGAKLILSNFNITDYKACVVDKKITIPARHTCHVTVRNPIRVDFKNRRQQSVVQRFMYSASGNSNITITPDYTHDGMGVLRNESGAVGPAYFVADANNNKWEWGIPKRLEQDENIIFPPVRNRSIAPGAYKGTATVVLSCE